jgi:hypothetical protein
MTSGRLTICLACLVLLGHESRLMAQSIDFGAAPTLNFPGQAADGKIYFYGQATFAAGASASATAQVYPDGGGVVLSIPLPVNQLLGPPGQSGLSFGTAQNPLSDCPISPVPPCKTAAKQGVFGAYGTVTQHCGIGAQ